MAVTGRFPILVALGAIPVLLDPTRRTVLLWALVCLVLAVLDLALAPSPTRLRLEREGTAAKVVDIGCGRGASVRPGGPTSSWATPPAGATVGSSVMLGCRRPGR